jgi:Amt family ammonium transporter
LFYTGDWKQLRVQAGAALTVIVWDGLMTFVILKLISLVVSLRMPDAVLEVGDIEVHGEDVLPVPLPLPGHAMPHPGHAGAATASGGALFSTNAVPPPTQT